jgi:hypothetical protein
MKLPGRTKWRIGPIGDTLRKRARSMEPQSIAATRQVNDVLRQHPRTGEVFIQHGRLSVAERGNFYLQYPHETVGEFAQRNGVDLEALLHQLSAVAEATDLEAKGLTHRPTARGRPPEQPIGYTSAYRELRDSDIETQPFVAGLLRRGPD